MSDVTPERQPSPPMRPHLLEQAASVDCQVLVRRLPDDVYPGIYWTRPRPAIFIDDRLDEREKDHVLAHELVHHVRGAVPDSGCLTWWAVVAREESRVDHLAARWLIPLDALARFCDERADVGEGVGPDEVMHEFDCTRRVAEHALDNLTRHERGR